MHFYGISMRQWIGQVQLMKTLLPLFFAACATTSHPVTPARLGTPRTLADLEQLIDQPGPLAVETVASADWEVPLSGMLNLEKAKLADRGEPIQVFAHVVRHPTEGVFWIDSGVERDARHIPGWIKPLMSADKLKILKPAAEIEKPKAVFLTHVHLDHVMGLPDLNRSTLVYSGAGDTAHRSFEHLATRGMFDAFLDGLPPIQEWPKAPVLDIFGDGSLWAIAVPGHTIGSTAYLARTTAGPVLMTGDACHTRYGWEHEIEPGTFSEDKAKSAESLQMLHALVARHPQIAVRLGHQR
jgi:N-acyl homoserine lactone hydrolase